MPVPQPRERESKRDFETRCMADETMVSEYRDRDQRVAICKRSWEDRNVSPNLNSRFLEFSINLTTIGRDETVNGVNYRVYPVTMLVEGVHHGAVMAPSYYSAEVLRNCAQQWNGVPVPIYHPQDAQGNYISANSNGVPNIGTIRNAFYENGKLKAEVWLQVDKAIALRESIIDECNSGNMEVSTGLFAEVIEQSGQWNGENYVIVIQSITPDHLALLPGQTGACSRDDGCGIRPHAKKEGHVKRYEALVAEKLKINEASHDEIRKQLMRYVDSLDMRRAGPDGHEIYKVNYVEAVYPTYFIYREESSDGTRLYKQFYTEQNGRVVIDQVKIEVFKKTEYLPVQGNSKGEKQMANDKPCCPEKVRALIANQNTTFTDADAEWLESLTADQLGHFEAMAEAAASNAKPKDLNEWLAIVPAEVRGVVNAGLKQLDKARQDMISTVLANKSNTFSEEQLKAMDNATLEGISALSVKPAQATYQNQYIGQGGGGATGQAAADEEPYVMTSLSFDSPTQ